MHENVFDAFAGIPDLPFECGVGSLVSDLHTLSQDLVQTKWRRSTRALYQGWLRLWLALCFAMGVAALPAQSEALTFFITQLCLTRGAGTVAIAASALIAFSSLNDFPNPFQSSPRASLALAAVKKARGGSAVPKKDGVSPEFIVKLWQANMARLGSLRFVEKRQWSEIQFGWEAAHRPGEISFAHICDIVRVCHLGETSSDLLDFTRGAKNDARHRGQVTRLIGGVGSDMPSFVYIWDHIWEPELRKMGFVRHPRCPSVTAPLQDRLRTFRCDLCPPLFPTMPVKNKRDSIVRSVCTSTITSDVRAAAQLIGLDDLNLSGKSLRIGGFSAATEDGNEELVGLAAAEMRWASMRVPVAHYKRRTVSEQRRTGQALQAALGRHAPVPPTAPQPMVGSTLATVPSLCVPSAALSSSSSLPPLPSSSSLHSMLPVLVMPTGVGCPYQGFPMPVTHVGLTEVCRRYQFGQCPHGTSCQYLHVCHVHGARPCASVSYMGLCEEARVRAAAWVQDLPLEY